VIYILYVLTVTSPYLLVFGDDRVHVSRWWCRWSWWGL